MNTIAIDCGASFIKGALFTHEKIVKRTHRKSPAVHGSGNILDAVQLSKLLPLVEDLIVELADGVTDFKLCISNEMHGFLLANEDGKPYTDYISWQKEYGNEVIDGESSVEILSRPEYKDAILRTGMPLRGGLPSSNLFYLKRKGLINNTPLYFYTLGDFIIRHISGKEPICHPTNAAATGLYDVTSSAWNKELLSIVANNEVKFPIVGNTVIEFDFKGRHVTCYPAIGDQQAALLGAGVEKVSDISFNLGTGAQVSRLVTVVNLSQEYQIRPYFNNFWLLTVPHLPSGRAMNVYFRFFKEILNAFGIEKDDTEIWQVLLEEEAKCDSTDLQCDLSFFQTPLTDHVTGSVGNIGEYGLTVGKLMKAIIRQMGQNFTVIANLIFPDNGKIERIVFSGGVARRINSLREEILKNYHQGIPVVVSEEETLNGLLKYGRNEW